MTGTPLRLATRQSPLALCQATIATDLLQAAHPGLAVELVPLVATGDTTSGPLAAAGGKELFVTTLREAVLAGTADAACHSLKDMAAAHPDLHLAAFLPRADPRDALVGATSADLAAQPRPVVGTSSPRRGALVAARWPQAVVVPLRGNVNTRLRLLDEGRCDALLLACAGLDRLGHAARIATRLDPRDFVPAPGQGTIALECRHADPRTQALLGAVDDPASRRWATAERACAQAIGGDCHTPLGVHARARAAGDGRGIELDGLLALDKHVVTAHATGTDPVAVGQQAASMLLDQQ